MDALDVLYSLGSDAGWDEDSMLEAACEYIDHQMDSEAFLEFVQRKLQEEQIADLQREQEAL